MSNEVFPALKGLTWDVTKSPHFETEIQSPVGGPEIRTAMRVNPVWNFEMAYDFLEGFKVAGVSELEKLAGLFLRHKGSFDSFLYLDPDDNAVTDQVIGTGNGVQKSFQMVRTWAGFTEPLCQINVIGNVKVNGVATTAYTQTKGLLTLTTIPANGAVITWSGSYYYRARFADDYIDLKTLCKDLWEAKKVELVASLGNRI